MFNDCAAAGILEVAGRSVARRPFRTSMSVFAAASPLRRCPLRWRSRVQHCRAHAGNWVFSTTTSHLSHKSPSSSHKYYACSLAQNSPKSALLQRLVDNAYRGCFSKAWIEHNHVQKTVDKKAAGLESRFEDLPRNNRLGAEIPGIGILFMRVVRMNHDHCLVYAGSEKKCEKPSVYPVCRSRKGLELQRKHFSMQRRISLTFQAL